MASMVVRLAEKRLVTNYGIWSEFLYYDGRRELVALVSGDIANRHGVPCRLQSHCLSAFVFNSIECDCREQVALSQRFIQEQGCGLIIWLDQEGRGQGHMACMLASELSAEANIDETVAYERLGYHADARSYAAAAHVLRDLGVASVQLLSNAPNRVTALEQNGVRVDGRTGIVSDVARLRRLYADKVIQGHIIDLPPSAGSD